MSKIKTYKRIRYRKTADGILVTPNFFTHHDVLRGYIKDNLVEIYSLDGPRLFFQLCGTEEEAKELMRIKLEQHGVEFLDEVRRVN